MPQLGAFAQEIIEQYIDKIDNNDFKHMYENVLIKYPVDAICQFTEAMLEAKLDPLAHLDYVPAYYLYESENPNIAEKLYLPEHITQVNAAAFYRCESIKSIYLPKACKEVFEFAFSYLPSLQNLEIRNPDIIMNSLCFPSFISEIIFDGTLDQWIDFIIKNNLDALTADKLTLLKDNKTIQDYMFNKLAK